MVYRLEMVPRFGQRNILQYMVPWLHNIELVEGALLKNPSNAAPSLDSYPAITTGGDRVLTGTGWGSSEGTRLVLYNLLSITSKVSGRRHVCIYCTYCGLHRYVRTYVHYMHAECTVYMYVCTYIRTYVCVCIRRVRHSCTYVCAYAG